jgi:signal transduction histidine kinase
MMRNVILPRHFIFSVLLLLALIAAYIFSEARRFQQELLRQTEAQGLALANAMETGIRSAILGNSLLEELISQRLLDNARLIDQLLRFPPVDQKFIQEIAARNGLRKVELLDLHGQPLKTAPALQRMEEMMARKREFQTEEFLEKRHPMMTFMWGRRWNLPQAEGGTPPKGAEKKFWEGSVFGVAIGASSFPGIIAVHADADYILNFRKEIEVQKQIDELGRQPEIEHVAWLDKNGKILAHTDSRLINQLDKQAPIIAIQANQEPFGHIVEQGEGKRHYDVVKPITVNGSNMGVLEIGLSLKPMEVAWRRALTSMIVFGLAILVVGILGMATIFYNQQTHLQKVKSLEAEINRQERLSELGNLAATVAHEIRNPLNSVSMGLQRLKGEFTPTQDQDDYERFLDLMQAEVRRLNSIVEQFLSLARPLNLKVEPVSIETFLKDVTTLMSGDASSANVQIDLNVAPGLPSLQADPNYLKQLLLNLILNGVQAMPRGGALTIDARADKDFLRLTVSDHGTGMTAETLAHIFEPYFTTKPNGSGLGLSIARRIAEAHGGTINVESNPGRGSRFQVLLPFKSAEA